MNIFKGQKRKLSAKSLSHSKENFSLAIFQSSKVDQNKVIYTFESVLQGFLNNAYVTSSNL